MKDKTYIKITEQDIFNFIFYPNEIIEEKRDLISQNESLAEIVEFYKNLKVDIDSKFDFSIKKKIAEKIPVYSLPKVIELYQLKYLNPEKKLNRLAADSEKELKPKITTKTFIDEDKDYLVKVLQNGNNTKIFVFSTKDEIIENFNLFIEPLELEFYLKDNTEPLILEGKVEVDKIRIHFD